MSNYGTHRVWRQKFMGSLACFVALAVAFTLANPPSVNTLLFVGGLRDAGFGVAMLLLIPLIIIIQFALGVSFARAFGQRGTAGSWFLWLSGSAISSLVGVAVAAVGAINPWFCGSLFVLSVTFAFWSIQEPITEVFQQLLIWIRLKDVANEKLTFAIVRLGILAALFLVELRAATGELNDTDVVQFYWGWLNEVRHLGGIRLSPELPLIQDFTAGRGNGNYLFSAGLAPGLVSHAVSAVFCVMFAVGLRSFILLTAPQRGSKSAMLLAADLTCFAALWMLPGSVAFGKYHLQFAAWALGFLLVSIQIANDDDAMAQAKCRLVMPLAAAIAIGLAQFEAFIVLVLALAVSTAPMKWRAAQRLFPLLVVGFASAAISLAANWLYLGIPDYNPFPLFERFIVEPQFGFWTSRLQQYYLNYIQGGALTFKASDGVGIWRELRSLLGGIYSNLGPIVLSFASLLGLAVMASLPAARRLPQRIMFVLLGALLGYVLYLLSLRVAFYDLALTPAINRLALYILASIAYLAAVRPFRDVVARSFLLGLLGYWLICAAFILIFHSGSMGRLMRHADVVFVGLLLVALVHGIHRISTRALVVPIGGRDISLQLRKSAAAPLLLALGIAFSFRAGASAWAVDPPGHLLASTLGLQGRAVGLTNPMAKFERCDEIARSVPPSARVLVLNAYTAMAYCNNAVLLPRAMVVLPHASDFARDLKISAFADADTVEQTLRRMHIDYFLVLKSDTEFWTSGLGAPFRPDELARRFDLLAETPSFYILTWHGAGHAIPPQVLAEITEWRRIAIQHNGFMAQNEFVGQWRAMANLGADKPKYNLGSRLDFTSDGWSALYADHGWYQADPDGTWTVGPVAVFRLPLAQPSPDALRMTIDVMPFLVPQLPARTVHVRVGATEVAIWTFKLGDKYQAKEIVLPSGAAASGEIVLTLEIENSVSPYSLGLSSDSRPLGLSVRNLIVENVGVKNQ